MAMAELKARYNAADLEAVFVGGRSSSADEKVLERFFEPLKRNQLSDDAVIAYGMHLMHTDDEQYLTVWVHAMHELTVRNPDIIRRVRTRPRLNFQQLVQDKIEVPRSARRVLMAGVAEKLREHFPPDSSENEQLLALIAQLDQQS